MLSHSGDFVRVEFLRPARAQDGRRAYKPGDVLATNIASAERWERTGAAKIIESTAPAKPNGKAKARKKKETN